MLLPTKQTDLTLDWDENIAVHPYYGVLYRSKTIIFSFKNSLEGIPEEDWGKIKIKFRVESVDVNDYADNNLNGPYYAKINNVTALIPRPVGYLDIYSINLSPNQSTVNVRYTASDVSGIYKINATGYYWDGHETKEIFTKTSTANVYIPYLVEVERQKSEIIYYNDMNEERMIWYISGQMVEHSNNNYLQSYVEYKFGNFARKYIKETKENDNNWFIFRLNDMSLPWGGMFWIGYESSSDLTVNRVYEWGEPYTIQYVAYIHERIYAPEHKFHRDGLNIDFSPFSDDGWGNASGLSIYEDRMVFLANKAGFAVLHESSPEHFHIKYVSNDNINYYYDVTKAVPYFPNFSW